MPQSKILIAHGVNLDRLGSREPQIYGSSNLAEINDGLFKIAPLIAQMIGSPAPLLDFFQSNAEHELLNQISSGYDGILINPGAWTHTSLALADRLKGLAVPYVEVHLSNTASRETFRHHSYTAPHAAGVVSGFGAASYQAGLLGLMLKLQNP